mgnify:CR=1 FL=1
MTVIRYINFTNILSFTSIYSSNRQALFHLLNQESPTKVKTSSTYHDFTTWLKSSSKKQTKVIKKSFEDNDFLTNQLDDFSSSSLSLISTSQK